MKSLDIFFEANGKDAYQIILKNSEHCTFSDCPILVNILKEISGLISTSLDIMVYNLSYENGIILMKGEAKNVDDISAIKSELMKSKYFKEVTMGSTSLTREGGKVSFDLRIEVK